VTITNPVNADVNSYKIRITLWDSYNVNSPNMYTHNLIIQPNVAPSKAVMTDTTTSTIPWPFNYTLYTN
jgi:hypothetical protein